MLPFPMSFVLLQLLSVQLQEELQRRSDLTWLQPLLTVLQMELWTEQTPMPQELQKKLCRTQQPAQALPQEVSPLMLS
jgi:hypothetical protein